MRFVSLVFVATLLGGGLGCTPPPGPSTEPTAATQEPADRSTFELQYGREPFRLREVLDMTVTVGGEANGALAIQVEGTLSATPHDDAQLRVDAKLDTVQRYELTGSLKPPLPSGVAEPDFAKLLVGATSHAVVDMRGEEDKAASEGLTENKAKERRLIELQERVQQDPQLMGELLAESLAFAAVLSLPQLPEQSLAIGRTIEVPPATEPRPVGASELAVTVRRTYTVAASDDADSKRIILDFVIDGEASDEVAGPNGAVSTTYHEHTDGKLLFDLNSRLPVSIAVTQSTTNITDGKPFEQKLVLNASFEPVP